MKSGPPLVTVLVPSYNHNSFITECLDSIRHDGYPRLELIIIDDGSTDESETTIRNWCELNAKGFERLIFERQENRGLNKTLNRGLKLASGDVVAILASDDTRIPGMISAQVEAFEANSRLKALYANGRTWSSGSATVGDRVHSDKYISLLDHEPSTILDFLLSHVPVLFIQAAMYKRDFLLGLGGFDESVNADDWVLNIRVFRTVSTTAEYGYLDADVFRRRVHTNNAHSNLREHLSRILEVVAKYVPAQRQKRFRADVYRQFAEAAAHSGRWFSAIRYAGRAQIAEPSIRWMIHSGVRLATRLAKRTSDKISAATRRNVRRL